MYLSATGKLRSILSSILVIGFLIPMGCGENKEKANKRGEINASQKAYSKAIIDFKKALEVDPTFYRARLNLAQSYLARGSEGDLQDARVELKKCLDQDPSNPEPWFFLIETALAGEKPNSDEAQGYCLQAIQRHPASAKARVALASLLAAVGKRQEALEVFRLALDLDPKNVEARIGLAQTLLETGGYAEAEKVLQQGLKEGVERPTDIRITLVRLYLHRGETDSASQILAEVPEDDTTFDVSAQRCRTAIMKTRQAMESGKDPAQYIQESRAIFEKVPEKTRESSRFREILGLIFFDEKNYTDSDRILNPLLRRETRQGQRQPGEIGGTLDLNVASYHLYLGRCLMEQNFPAKAQAEFVEAGHWDPMGIDSIFWEAVSQLGEADDKRVEEILRKAVPRLREETPSDWGKAGRRFYPPITPEWIAKLEEWNKRNPDSVAGRILPAALAFNREDLESCARMIDEATTIDPKFGLGYFMKAAVLEKQGKVEEAFNSLQSARDADPGLRRASAQLAKVFFAGGRPDLAAREYLLALKGSPKDTTLMVGLAGAYAAMKRDDAAIQTLYQALDIDDKNFEALALLTQIYLRKGLRAEPAAFDELLKLSDRILKSRPNDRYALAVKAETLIRKGELKPALESFRQLSQTSPTNASIAGSVAIISVLLGDSKGAQKDLETASQIVPASTELDLSKAYVEMAVGNYASALNRIRNLEAADKEKETPRVFEANCLLLQSQPDKAVQSLEGMDVHAPEYMALYESLPTKDPANLKETVLSLNDIAILADRGWWVLAEGRTNSLAGKYPDNPLVLWWQAICSLNLGDPDKALELCGKVTDAVPEAGNAWAIQGTIYGLKKDYNKAIECHRKRLALYPNDPQMSADIHVVIGTLLDRLGKIQDGIEEYKLALQNDADNAVALNNTAWRLSEIGDLEDGLKMAQKAATASPNQGEFRDTYGWIALQLSEDASKKGDTGRASELLKTSVEQLGRAANLTPYSPGVRHRLGLALLKTGEKAGALTQFQWALKIGEDFPEKADAQKMVAQLSQELGR